GRRDREDALEPQRLERVREHALRRLERIALRPEARQQREAEIGVRELVSLQQAADADRLARRPELHTVEPEAVTGMALHGSGLDVALRVRAAAYAAVPDEAQESRIVEQLANEVGVSRGQAAKGKTWRLEHEHRGLTGSRPPSFRRRSARQCYLRVAVRGEPRRRSSASRIRRSSRGLNSSAGLSA